MRIIGTNKEKQTLSEAFLSPEEERQLRAWYGRYKTHDKHFIDFVYEIGERFNFRSPRTLYRGLYIDKNQLDDIDVLYEGVHSWTKAVSYAKAYASGGKFVRNPISCVIVWNSPQNIILDGDKVNRAVEVDIFDPGEFIADATRASFVDKEQGKNYYFIYISE